MIDAYIILKFSMLIAKSSSTNCLRYDSSFTVIVSATNVILNFCAKISRVVYGLIPPLVIFSATIPFLFSMHPVLL